MQGSLERQALEFTAENAYARTFLLNQIFVFIHFMFKDKLLCACVCLK